MWGGAGTAGAAAEEQVLQVLSRLELPEAPAEAPVPPALRQEWERQRTTVRDLVAKLADALQCMESIRQAAAGDADEAGETAGPPQAQHQ